jgi:hypothetical protein
VSKLLLPDISSGHIDLSDEFKSLLDPSFARGTNAEGDVLTQTVDGRSLDEIWREFQQSLTFFNGKRQAIVDLLTFAVTAPIEEVPQGIYEDFEEASEFGEPKGIRGGTYFQLGYDFKWYDIAIRYTWKFLAEASAAQVEALNAAAMEADNRLVFKKVLRAVFNNVNRLADIRGQAVNVYPFYNADGTVPPTYKNTTFLSTHNHYITSGAAAIVSADMDDLEEHLVHHGYGSQNGSQMIAMVNRTEGNVMRTWRVSTGASYDFIPSQGQPSFLLPGNGIEGGRPANTYRGLSVIGSYGPWLIIQDDYIPTKYVVAFATGGEQNASNPVGFREHQNPGLRGLRLLRGAQHDYPLVDSFYQRGFGTGVRHRGAGIVMEITADPTYDIPAAYV